ncbi:MAG: hypothetical protein GYB31_00705 [Bacteroidetes bacterium]|nr:hypothetical protein [Bacteroidota bacterium]
MRAKGIIVVVVFFSILSCYKPVGEGRYFDLTNDDEFEIPTKEIVFFGVDMRSHPWDYSWVITDRNFTHFLHLNDKEMSKVFISFDHSKIAYLKPGGLKVITPMGEYIDYMELDATARLGDWVSNNESLPLIYGRDSLAFYGPEIEVDNTILSIDSDSAIVKEVAVSEVGDVISLQQVFSDSVDFFMRVSVDLFGDNGQSDYHFDFAGAENAGRLRLDQSGTTAAYYILDYDSAYEVFQLKLATAEVQIQTLGTRLAYLAPDGASFSYDPGSGEEMVFEGVLINTYPYGLITSFDW